MAASDPSSRGTVDPLCTLPVLGETTVEDTVFYAGVGVVAMFGLVSWPSAALFSAVHAVHQRARNGIAIGAGALGEAREGLIEAAEDTT